MSEHYSLAKILGIWALAAAPMGILGWIIFPLLAPDFESDPLEFGVTRFLLSGPLADPGYQAKIPASLGASILALRGVGLDTAPLLVARTGPGAPPDISRCLGMPLPGRAPSRPHSLVHIPLR